MKKLTILLITILLIGCKTSATKNEDIIIELTNEEQLNKLYQERIKPLFSSYRDIRIPNDFRIDKEDNSINAGAADGYIEASQGLVDYDKEYIKVYVLSHEIGHIVTLNQAGKFELGSQIPSGIETNDYKKAEYLADLIAIHLMLTKERVYGEELKQNLEVVQSLLGPEIFTHPSAVDRVEVMNLYIEKSFNEDSNIAFKEIFEKVWNMD
ncbi:M48 family metalloprotease [Tenacibaculum retecalamus]|uniref:hypothetical protein n=1 Tax=Tenacibaculum retecalamus TaxID=3018315 RepID=UPI0023D921FE|nr:hypothetical protein [Tenacibaculum retecalamus]WBX70761.1 hypothetical protein PG912_11090 [Tenacibaculum retecalamus]